MAEEYVPDDTPASADNHDGGANYTLGEKQINSGAGADKGIRFWVPASVAAAPTVLLYEDGGVLLDSAVASGYTPGSYHTEYFATPIDRPDATTRVAAFFTPDGRYGATVPGGYPISSAAGNLTSISDNGWIHDGGGTPIYPETEHGANARFHVSSVFEPAATEESKSGEDAGTLADTAALSATAGASDSGALADAGAMAASVPASDSAAVVESATRTIVGAARAPGRPVASSSAAGLTASSSAATLVAESGP